MWQFWNSSGSLSALPTPFIEAMILSLIETLSNLVASIVSSSISIPDR